jgi:toxin YoeB
MLISFTDRGQQEYDWMEHHEPKLSAKIDTLIDAILVDPFSGLGKPEPLKHEYSGCWSRRINQQHRLVYRVDDDRIIVLQCRSHY